MSYISGNIFGEKLIGTSGDDTIDGKGGSLYDIIDGGAGNDTALIFDNSKNYSVITLSGITHVIPSPSAISDYRYGETILTHVEYLQFADTKIPIQTTSLNTIFGGHTYFPDMKMVGTENNDIFDFLGRDYPIDGGAGNDTVLLFDKQSNYNIITLDGITRIISSYQSYSWYKYNNYTLTNIEYIQFSDGIVALPGAPKIITGDIGNDSLSASAANDIFDGGPGIDTVIYSGIRSAFQVAKTSAGYTVRGGSEDTLTNIERLQFTDTYVALDIDGNAGKVAKILASVFGASAVSNKEYAGIGLDLIDGGMSYEALSALAINTAGAHTREAVVDLLWTNLMGSHPTTDQAKPFVDMLAPDLSNIGTLGVIAADYAATIGVVNLTTLSQTGLEYI